MNKTFAQRIEEHVERIPECGCWIWMRSPHNNGYGRIKIGQKNHLVHRASYEAFVGPIPDGASILHRCDLPLCVNPAHLKAGTHADNMDDMKSKGRQQRWCLGKFGAEHPSYKGQAHVE